MEDWKKRFLLPRIGIFVLVSTILGGGAIITSTKINGAKKYKNIESIVPIKDLNQDKFPELKIKYNSGEIDTVYSDSKRKNTGEILYNFR